MKKLNLFLTSLLQALGVFAYVALISGVFSAGSHFQGKLDQFWGPVLFLLLFVLSAAITGSLVFGRSVLMYLNDAKKEAVKLTLFTMGWLAVMAVILLAVFALS